jgi:uncharacterized protein (TIGR02453 family)
MAASKKPPAPLPPFAGFPKEGLSWFDGLALAQNKEWFQAHRDGYELLWLQPMTALLTELKQPLEKLYGQKLGAPRIFRLNRDVRFSKDKRPYKTNIAGMLPFEGNGPMEGPAPVYLSLGSEEYYGFGFYFLEGSALVRFRKAVLDEKKGAALQKLVDAAVKAGMGPDAMETLKRPPPGVDKAHPRVELLKRKGIAIGSDAIPKKVRFGPGLKHFLLAQAKVAQPVVQWGFEQRL